MSALGHYIIEDAICELCDEPALPFDDYSDVPYCAAHKMETYTNASLEDFTYGLNGVRRTQDFVISQLTRPLSDDSDCEARTREHACDAGHSRLSPGDFMHITMDTCVPCAAAVWMPADLLEMDDWRTDLALELEDADFDALDL